MSERFSTLRQSRLAVFDSCALRARFEEDYRRDWSGHPQARGQIVHRVYARALEDMHLQNERSIPTDAMLQILFDELRMTDGELVNIPFEQVKDMRWEVVKFATDNEFDIENLMDVEHRLSATVSYDAPDGSRVDRVLTGQLDALFVAENDDNEAVVLDYKSTWDLPAPSEVGFEGYFQQRFYALLVMDRYPAFQRVTLRELYTRRSVFREATVYRDDLPYLRQEFAALAQRFDRAFETDEFPPSPGRHCFAGETRVLTGEGIGTLAEMAGRQVEVMNRHGDWEWGEVRSFGEQPLLRLTFDDGSVVRATPDHRWWKLVEDRRNGGWRQTDERVTTAELDRVPITHPSPVPMTNEGIRHGFTFGDGYRRPGRPSCVALFMPQDAHMERYFGTVKTRKDGRRWVGGLPVHYKDLPDRPAPSYARGFIAGLFAADGHVNTGGISALYCEGRERAEAIAELARLGGCVVSSVRLHSDRPTAYSAVGTVTRELMRIQIKPATLPVLRPDHHARLKPKHQMRRMYREVVSVEDAGVEEVFCAVVPGSESFTLANGIATSNCQLCPLPGNCPIFPDVRVEGMITDEATAVRVAGEAKVARAAMKQRETALRAWASVHGDVPISSTPGREQVWGFKDHKRVSRPTKDQLEKALYLQGKRIDLDRLYRESVSTKFEPHYPEKVEDLAEDVRLYEALQASVEAPEGRGEKP